MGEPSTLHYNQLQTGLLLVSRRLRCGAVSMNASGSRQGCKACALARAPHRPAPRCAPAAAPHRHAGPEAICSHHCSSACLRRLHVTASTQHTCCDLLLFFIRVFTFHGPLGLGSFLFPCFELGVMIKEAWEICFVVLEGCALDGLHVHWLYGTCFFVVC